MMIGWSGSQSGSGSSTPQRSAMSPMSISQRSLQLGVPSSSRSSTIGVSKNSVQSELSPGCSTWAQFGPQTVSMLLLKAWKKRPLAHRLSAAICPGSSTMPLTTRRRPHVLGARGESGAQLTPTLHPGAVMARFFTRPSRMARMR